MVVFNALPAAESPTTGPKTPASEDIEEESPIFPSVLEQPGLFEAYLNVIGTVDKHCEEVWRVVVAVGELEVGWVWELDTRLSLLA